MKKILYILLVVLVFILGIYTYNHIYSNIEEASYIKNDVAKDYEDIIIKRGNDSDKLIALTFDDGPDEVFTPQILDILNKHSVKATFFVVGQKVGWNPELVKREYEEATNS